MLTVVTVAYPLAAVGPDAVGGAEQIASALDHGLVAAGHRSIVVAAAGSITAGEHLAPEPVEGPLDEARIGLARARHAATLRWLVERTHVDVIHMHGVDFPAYLPPDGPPVLATLHCPVSWYAPNALHPRRPRTWLNAVSARQHAGLGVNDALLPPVENGVEIRGPHTHSSRRFALVLSRIAPEKGIHIALDAARIAGVPLLLAGQVYGYPEHRRYFEAEIVPRLDAARRFIGPVGGPRKRRLLAGARCLLVPSLVAETSSLSAREAIASGTPVIGLDAGALSDTIEDGATGFVVRDVAGMVAALHAVGRLDRGKCRQAGTRRFARERMVRTYIDLYGALAAGAIEMPRERVLP